MGTDTYNPSEPPHEPRLFEVRSYNTGWVVRFGRLLLRWNTQNSYREVALEWMGQSKRLVGGKKIYG